MSSLESRLLAVENTFSSALDQGEEAISAFNEQWEALLEDVNIAHESTDVEPKVLALAHTVALRIAELADASIELYNTCDNLTTKLVDELDSMMSELSLVDSPSPPPPNYRHPGKPLLQCEGVAKHSVALDETSVVNRKRRRNPNDGGSFAKRFRTDRRAFIEVSPSSARCPPSVQPVDSTAASKSRKRRLSDSDTSFSPLPHKRLLVGPRLHAVSDSFLPHHSGETSPSTRCVSSEISISRSQLRPFDDADACLDVQPFNQFYEALGAPQPDSPTFVDIVPHLDPWSEYKTVPSPQTDLDDLSSFINSLLDASVGPSMPTSPTLICTTAYTKSQDANDVASSASFPDADPQTPSSSSSSDGTPSYPSTPVFNAPIALEPSIYGDFTGPQPCSEDRAGFPGDIPHQKRPLCLLDGSEISNSQNVPLPWYSEQAHSIEGSPAGCSFFDDLDVGVWTSALRPPFNFALDLRTPF